MSTATVSQTDALQQLTELKDEADVEQTRHRDELVRHETSMNEILAKIRDTADGACGDFQTGNNGAAPATTTPQPARARGPKKKATAKKNASGSSSVKKKATKKKGVKVSATDRNYDNKKTLGQAIWHILDRDNWPALKSVPDSAPGLTAGEIKTLILLEKDWQSAGADPGNQISAQLGKFHHPEKGEPVIARGDERRYYIIKGAKYPGK